MPTFECLCCSWKGESHRFPKHAITHHLDSVCFCRTQFDHCAYLYLKKGRKDVEFTICLSCKKGTTSDNSTGNGARWLSRHELSEKCKSAHLSAFAAFKKQCAEAVGMMITTDTSAVAVANGGAGDIVTTVTPTVSILSALDIWEKCKQTKDTHEAFVEAEEKVREAEMLDYDDEDPEDTSVLKEYVFDPIDGFIQVARFANDFKKQYKMTKQEMEETLSRLDKEMVEHRRAIMDQHKIIHNQTQALRDYRKENTELTETVKLQEEKLVIQEEKLKIQEETVKTYDQKMKELQAELDALKAKCSAAGIV